MRFRFLTVFWILGPVLLVAVRAENLLLITVDTLRADHLSAYGYAANKTPAIDRWAREGILFRKAYAEVPLTLPSHSTLMTGTLPVFHGVRDNAGFVLPGESITLAEVLEQKGYQTAAFVSSYVLASRFGIAQGFQHYSERFGSISQAASTGALRRPAPETTADFLDWLESHRQKPFFAWIHFYDPHAPYPSSYDREISRVDESISAIDSALRRLKLIDETHIFFLSDHGESLGEHGESAHGFFIYDASLRVPWIFRPAQSLTGFQKEISEPFSLLDVMPTALQLLAEGRTPVLQGRSALAAMLGKPARPRSFYAESYLPQLQFGWSPLRSIRQDNFKFIEAPRAELYDLDEDPGEKINLFPSRQSLGLQLRERLNDLSARYRAPAAPQAARSIDPETASRLASLGYVSVSSPRIDDTMSDKPDPKDRVSVFEEYQQALVLVNAGDIPEALQKIESLRSQGSGVRGLFYLEALARERGGQLEESAGLYLKALSEDPENNLARANLANIYLRLNRFREAEKTLGEVLGKDPGDYRARNNLGMLWRLQGRDSEALVEFQKVVETAADYAPGWVNLAIGLAQRGRVEEAEKAFGRAIDLDATSAAAHFHFARLLQGLGRTSEAQREMSIAVRLDPRLATQGKP